MLKRVKDLKKQIIIFICLFSLESFKKLLSLYRIQKNPFHLQGRDYLPGDSNRAITEGGRAPMKTVSPNTKRKAHDDSPKTLKERLVIIILKKHFCSTNRLSKYYFLSLNVKLKFSEFTEFSDI